MADVKLEFVVRMTCGSCEDAVKKALENKNGVKSVFADHQSERVIVETSLNSAQVQRLIEGTGRQAVLQGIGSGKGVSMRGLGAAVAMMGGRAGAQGVTRLVQTDEQTCVIEGTLDGLQPGKHRLQIHEFGDLSDECNRCGDVFNPAFREHQTKYGDLGVIDVQEDGRADFRLQDKAVKVWDIIGRSMVLTNLAQQQQAGNDRIACGIIARSSGLFENDKRICACDGITIWDERNVPAAGSQRSAHVQANQSNEQENKSSL